VGLCVTQNNDFSPKQCFKKLFVEGPSKKFLKNAEIKENIGGAIPLGFLKKTYDDNVMVVGDAAAQVKPTSGGGIFPGLSCAKHCVSTALGSINKKDFSQKFLREYHKKWIKDIGNELSRGMKFRIIYKNLSDKKMDKYIKKFNDQRIIETINEHGDIDFPSKLVKPLLKKSPSLIGLIPSIIKE
jgi:flavin-dependent dehydrogenase